MQEDLRREYEQIGQERDEASRLAAREKRRFFVKVAVICWVWTVIGLVLVGRSFNINATIGNLYFPGLMQKAGLYMSAGLFVGTAGPIATLIVGWRKATERGYLD